jgi:hypothetical protein
MRSFHDGPAPYILHIHVDIMPIKLAAAYASGKLIAPFIDLAHRS